MLKHEEKICPKCQHLFECKTGSIEICQCNTISLVKEERAYIQKLHEDCLCANCLRELKTEFHQLKYQKKLEKISSLFCFEK